MEAVIEYFLQLTQRNGVSKYNPIFDFKYNNVDVIFTSVSGHLMQMDFDEKYKGWQQTNPLKLFEAEIVKFVPKVFYKI